jgi:YfiH family protein
VHAGWRGAVDGVVVAALDAMQHYFGSSPADLQVWIGPHARTCCYQVDQKFYESVMQKQFGTTSWYIKQDALFFDLKQCCTDQLITAGVRIQHIADSGICTVCTPTYCSYRQEKEAALRNISFIGIVEGFLPCARPPISVAQCCRSIRSGTLRNYAPTDADLSR